MRERAAQLVPAAHSMHGDKRFYQRQIQATDEEIDALVYESYGSTEEEIATREAAGDEHLGHQTILGPAVTMAEADPATFQSLQTPHRPWGPPSAEAQGLGVFPYRDIDKETQESNRLRLTRYTVIIWLVGARSREYGRTTHDETERNGLDAACDPRSQKVETGR